MSTFDAPPPPRARPVRPARRSRWPWLLVAGFALATFGFAAAGLARAAPAVRDLAKDGGKGLESRFPSPRLFPGTERLALDAPGKYRIYHEYVSHIDGRNVDSEIGPLAIEVRSVATGAEVPLRSVAGAETYDLPHRKGRAIRTFEVDAAGEYDLTATRAGGGDTEFVLAVGRPVLAGFFAGAAPVLFMFLLAGFSFLAALVTTVVLLVRRR